MNYLAHAWVLGERTPALVLGTALPDLLGAFDRRSPRLVAPLLEERGEHELARGVRAHHAADVSFHGLAAFGEACATIRGELAKLELGHVRLFFAAHLLVEILIDAELLGREPDLGRSYYEALEASPVSRAALVVEESASFETFVRRFTASRFLLDYGTDEGVVHRLGQVLGRARQTLGDGAAERLIERLPSIQRLVRDRFDSLTLAPRAAASVGV